MSQRLPAGFAGRVVRWQRTHGRNTLPWQNTRDPIACGCPRSCCSRRRWRRCWATTSASCTLPRRAALAAAPLDDVLALWSGLGYYSRARNLHRCAQEVVRCTAGLPAHGAGAADAARHRPLDGGGDLLLLLRRAAAILDGNVKRVLTRVLASART
jgi:A/G-specific adenine glycosylase